MKLTKIKIRTFFLAFTLFVMLGSMVHAAVGSDLCVDLFDPSGNLASKPFSASAFPSPTGAFPNAQLISLRGGASYTGLLFFSLLLVLLVLSLMGIAYALGSAFQIRSITDFVKTEYLQTVLNLAIIVFIMGGMLVVDNLVVGVSQFIGYVASTATSSLVGVGNPIITAPSITNINDLYVSSSGVCENYWNDAKGQIINIIAAGVLSFSYGIVGGIYVEVMPSFFGFAYSPFAGMVIPIHILELYSGALSLVLGMEVGMILFMAIIYYLFPIFLYLGILFRCFPWTRAAGGAFLGLFIAFYIFFPAILYPFSLINFSSLAPLTTSSPPLITGIGDILTTTFGFVSVYVPGLIESLTTTIAYSLLQVFGIVAALIVSEDVLELFGDVLGAPSLQAKNFLRKVV